MGTPGDRGEEEERTGGWKSEWQSGGWQSQWQQPGSEQGWRQDEPQQQPAQPVQPGGPAGWQQTPDGRWIADAPSASGKATASLVLGLVGLVFCPLICSVLAIVFGYQARREIAGSGGKLAGGGSATAGIILGWIGTVIYGIFALLVVIGLLAGGS
jgi:hypothetical protein